VTPAEKQAAELQALTDGYVDTLKAAVVAFLTDPEATGASYIDATNTAHEQYQALQAMVTARYHA
jgi:hypothetical protein